MNMQARVSTPQAPPPATRKSRSIEIKNLSSLESIKCAAKSPKLQCKDCALSQLCLAKSTSKDSMEALSNITKHPKPIQKAKHFYRQNDAFESLYIVRSGAVKTYYIDGNGEEHITGFHLPGETFGIDGIIHGQHKYSAQALDTCAVCEVPYQNLEQIFNAHADIQRQLMDILCSEIYERQQPLLSLRQNPAEQRLATFLTQLSAQHCLRGLSATEFTLPMSRRDIAGYLGVAEETMSRLFTRFQQRLLLSVTGRAVLISDLPALKTMSVSLH